MRLFCVRSRALTKGSRWKIFALFLIFFVAMLLVQAVIKLLGGIAHVGAPLSVVTILLSGIVSSFTTLIGATGIASMYVELRSEKEGASFANLAEIFS